MGSNHKSIIDSWNLDSEWSLFLDRDGVINRKLDGYVTHWENFSFLPGVLDSMECFNNHFQKICIVTNQQGIDKGSMTHEDLGNIHSKMIEIIEFYHGRIDQVYYEPSLAAYDSPRRKPNPGMFLDAQRDFKDINLKKSIIIGDSWSDMAAGKAVGAKTVFIHSKLTPIMENKILENSDIIIGGLQDFCGLINR